MGWKDAAILLVGAATAFFAGEGLRASLRAAAGRWPGRYERMESLPAFMTKGKVRVQDLGPCSYGFCPSTAVTVWASRKMSVWSGAELYQTPAFSDVAVYARYDGTIHLFVKRGVPFEVKDKEKDQYSSHVDPVAVFLVPPFRFRWLLEHELRARSERERLASDVMGS